MTRYAEKTSVPAERSKAEIEATLVRYGADAFGYMVDGEQAVIRFRAHDRFVQFVLPMPEPTDQRFTHHSRGVRTPEAMRKEYEQATRQRWRALALAVKAKLEAVETGITTFEDEFLAHIVLPDGTTFGRWAAGEVERVYATGEMPKALLALPAPAESDTQELEP